MITYYWPPAGGPGVQRALKFVKYLREYGWEPVILTVENGEYPAIDQSLVAEIPQDVKVYKTKTFSPLDIYKKLMGIKGTIPTHVLSKKKNESLISKIFKWIRINLYIPDGRKDWIKVIVKEGAKIIQIEKPDLIYSTSPPHSVQVGAMRLAQKTGVKWVADFRDPWTDGFWLKGVPRMQFAWRKDRRLERSVLSKADGVITISDTWVDLFGSKVPNNYFALPNGYDHMDIKSVSAIKSDKFRIVYSGSLRESQIPYNLLKAIQDLREQDQCPQLELHFLGSLHPDVVSALDTHSLMDIVVMHGYVNHSVVIEHILDAQILLMLIPDTEDNEGILPGKIFEYMGCQGYILGVGPKGGEAEKLISKYGLGYMASFDEPLKDVVLQEYQDWTDHKEKTPKIDVYEYSRSALTKSLSNIFDQIA